MYKLSGEEKGKLKNHLGIKSQPGKNEIFLRKKAQKYARYFGYIPGVQGIFLCNSVAMNNAHNSSDIDLFIITEKNRLWTVRMYITVLCMILRIRKTKNHHAGKFCLSFFIDTSALDLEKIAIEKDVYLSYWIETLIPLVNKNYIYEAFIDNNLGENNQPLKYREMPDGYMSRVGDIVEKSYKKILLPRTLKKYTNLGKPKGIIINDHMLKFHNNDQREIIRNTVLK